MTDELPDKIYYKIGEISQLLLLKPSVLRFWESEFPQLAPKKSGSGQRLYTKNDLELVRQIRTLLYDDKLTIEGAKKSLQQRQGVKDRPPLTDQTDHHHLLAAIKSELISLRNRLNEG